MGKFLIANSDSGEVKFLAELTGKSGSLFGAENADQAMLALRAGTFDVAFVDAAMALDPSLRSHLPLVTCVLLTGAKGAILDERVRDWPFEQFVDRILISADPEEIRRSRKVVGTAEEYAKLKSAVAELTSSKAVAENRLRRVAEEIRGLSSSLTTDVARELEKRIDAEIRVRQSQRLKEGIEGVLRRIYSAGDVNNLIDAVSEIKDLLQAESISLYLVEDNGPPGKQLKPLVWGGLIPEHGEGGTYSAALEAPDFAAFVARTGSELRVLRPEGDRRMSDRYRTLLRTPLRGLIAAPLSHGGSVIGLLEAYNKIDADGRPADFSPDDQKILRSVSEHMSLAITNLNLIQYDALTGLLRPDPFFEKALHKLEVKSKRRLERGAWAMVMGDVDWFKLYNDRNGHEAGNRLLRDLAGLLKSSIRDVDLLCRYGGEEFLFLLFGVESIEEAMALTERIRVRVAEHHFDNEEFQPRGDLTMSFGVTLISPDDGLRDETVTKELLKSFAGEADLALAEAKGKPRPGLTAAPEETRNRARAFVREKAAILSPTALLEIPGEPEFVEKRRHTRYFASTLCIYRENGRHRVVPTIDLSLGGAKLSSPAAFPPDRTLEMYLVVGNQAQKIEGVVVYSRKISSAAAHFYSGVRFLELSEEDRRTFEDYFRGLARPGNPPR